MRYHLTPVRMAIIKKSRNYLNAGEGVEKRECYCTVGGNVNCCSHYGRWYGEKWQPIPVFLPGKSHGRRSLVGYSPWDRKESDMTKRLQFTILGIKPPYDPAIPLLGIHPEETKIEKDTCIPLFIAALFTITRTWKQLRCPLTNEWIKKL